MNDSIPSPAPFLAPDRGIDPGYRRGYGARWARVLPNLGYLIPTFFIAVAGLVVFITLFSLGLSLLILYIGVFILIAMFMTARGWGEMELRRLEAVRRDSLPRPVWRPTGGGPLSVIGEMLRDPHRWGYLLYAGIVQPVLGLFTWTLMLGAVSVALAGTTSWYWRHFIPVGPDNQQIGDLLALILPAGTITNPNLVTDITNIALGVVMLALLPLILDGLVSLHRVVAAQMLGRYHSDDLAEEISSLSASRSAAVSAENVGLRRLERDIHDGPQQRLIRLQMDLAAAERALSAEDPERAGQILSEARGHAGATLDELRALSRGFAPPLLQDRGLIAAVAAMAESSPLAVTVHNDLPESVVLKPEVELGAYFIVSELLTNAVKHSGAAAADISLSLIPSGGEGTPADTLWLRVSDAGQGGALARPGHGLAGLDGRVRGLRGTLAVHSPLGGPTVVDATIPLG